MAGALTSIGFGLAGSAALLYVLLRFFVATPNAHNTKEAIARHAFWTALIAFLASGTSGLANLWANPSPGSPGETAMPTMIMHAAAPGLWLGLVYILGQFTWPRHLRPVRSASLEVRSVKDVIPRFLAGFLLLCTIISTVLLIVAWNDAGAPSRAGNESNVDGSYQGPVYDGAVDDYGNPVDEFGHVVDLETLQEYTTGGESEPARPYVSSITGVRPGSEVGPYLLGGLGLVLLGTLGAAAVVVRRPPLDSLDAEDNAVLRSIWINRLLRTSVLVVAGFGLAAINYIAEGLRARGQWAIPLGDAGGFDSAAQDRANVLTGTGMICWLLVLVVAVAYAPPRLQDPGALRGNGAPSAAFSKARDFLLLTQFIGLVVVLLIVLFMGITPVSGTGTRLETLGSLAGALLLAAGVYLVLNIGAAWVISNRLRGDPLPAGPRGNLLPMWFVVVVSMAVTTGIAAITTFALAAPAALRPAAWWSAGVLAVVTALAGVLHRAAAHRPALEGASNLEDTKIRVLLAQRGVRVLGGVSLLIASMLGNPTFWNAPGIGYGESMYAAEYPSGFQITTLVLGVILFFLPAATARPAPSPNQPTPSLSNR